MSIPTYRARAAIKARSLLSDALIVAKCARSPRLQSRIRAAILTANAVATNSAARTRHPRQLALLIFP